MARKKAPVTPAVVEWAVRESGFQLGDLAGKLGHSEQHLEAWINGSDQPTQAQLRRLARHLRRPSALFYLSAPPGKASLLPTLRSAPGLRGCNLSVEEIRVIRWFVRVQMVLSWIRSERLGAAGPSSMPFGGYGSPPEVAARRLREWVGVSIEKQTSWADARVALREWRDALSGLAVAVFQFQISREAIRGFSIWDEYLPIAAVNTAYTPQARVYTLFHEIGHLLNRTQGACRGFADPQSAKLERWCDEFAAAFLLPSEETRQIAVRLYDDGADAEDRYGQVIRIARRFNTSARATALRLIELGVADRSLYGLVDSLAIGKYDDFPRMRESGGGFGQRASQQRLQHFGSHAIGMLLGGVDSGHLTERDVGDFLHLYPNGVNEIRSLVNSADPPR